MTPFVHPDSIVRRIWGDADTILLVFAGSAAEFALNRAVDWLYFTGKLPADPLGRLFSTARFAQDIAFVDEEAARRSLHRIRAAHEAVERRRGEAIPAARCSAGGDTRRPCGFRASSCPNTSVGCWGLSPAGGSGFARTIMPPETLPLARRLAYAGR